MTDIAGFEKTIASNIFSCTKKKFKDLERWNKSSTKMKIDGKHQHLLTHKNESTPNLKILKLRLLSPN